MKERSSVFLSSIVQGRGYGRIEDDFDGLVSKHKEADTQTVSQAGRHKNRCRKIASALVRKQNICFSQNTKSPTKNKLFSHRLQKHTNTDTGRQIYSYRHRKTHKRH